MYMWELWVKFYLGQNEDYNLGDTDSSRKLLQRGRGGRSAYTWFWWRESTCDQAHIFLQKLSASLVKVTAIHKEWSPPRRMLVLFRIWGDEKNLSEDLFCQFSQRRKCLISALQLEFLLGESWKSPAAAAHDLIPVAVDGNCQFVVAIGKSFPPVLL